jgi:hypothetical protein
MSMIFRNLFEEFYFHDKPIPSPALPLKGRGVRFLPAVEMTGEEGRNDKEEIEVTKS